MEQTIYRDALFVVRVLNSCTTYDHLNAVNNLISNFVEIHPEADMSLCLSLQREYNRKQKEIQKRFWEESNKRFDDLLERIDALFKEALENGE